MKNNSRLLGLLGLLFLLLVDSAHANTWNAGTASWFVAGNWSAPAAVPAATDPALINNGGTAQVSTPGAVTSTLRAGSGGPGTVTLSGTGQLTTSLETWIGEDATGTLNVSGAPALFVSAGEGHVGAFGTGTLNIGAGSSASFLDAVYFGEIASALGTANVAGAAAILTTTGMIVGDEGRGALNISAGGTINSNLATILGYHAAGWGTIQLTGAGSTLNVGSDLRAGVEGQAGIAVNDLAVIDLSGHTIVLAENAGSTAELIIGAMNTPAGRVIANAIFGAAGTATVVFAHSTIGYDLSPPILGTARVLHTGTGSTHFVEANSYSGGTLISNGTLTAAHADALGVGPVENKARLSLEANLSLSSTYVQGATGTLDTAFIAPSCMPSSISVAEAVTLAGALSLRFPACTPTVGQSYLIVSTSASLSGTFAGLPEGATFLSGGQRFRVHYTPNAVSVTCLGADALGAGEPIPTLSQVGIAILSVLLTLGALIALRRRVV
ncbi:hypothetical protein BURK2_02352 [Burkholderiales bacterium]|nr:hypothetical protein BURK2_02352 [Burkholderiales bacterium]